MKKLNNLKHKTKKDLIRHLFFFAKYSDWQYCFEDMCETAHLLIERYPGEFKMSDLPASLSDSDLFWDNVVENCETHGLYIDDDDEEDDDDDIILHLEGYKWDDDGHIVPIDP